MDDIILLTEATHDQAYVMKACIEAFCLISGQRVNFEKSMVFCSENVNKQTAKCLADIYGSPLTTDLGRYLGVLLIHKRLNSATYADTIDKMHKRLAA